MRTKMFAKLKKKIAEEAATVPRTGVRIPRTISKESITSVEADSGDDFASDGSSSRDDLPAQLLRRNAQVRKLEAKLSASIKKLQEQNEFHQADRAKMAEGMTLALDKKDQEWMEKMVVMEKEKSALSERLNEMMEQSLALFQKRDDIDELEGFQQQELAKVKHMLLRKEEQLGQHKRDLQQKAAELHSTKQRLSESQEKLRALQTQHDESSSLNTELEIEREELLLLREEAEKTASELEGENQKFRSAIQQVSEDLHESQSMVSSLESSLHDLQTENDALKLQQKKSAVTEEDKERLLRDLQKKVSSLERRLQGNMTPDEHLQELLQEKSSLEQRLEEARKELLDLRTKHADTVSSLQAQISRTTCSITELQTLLRHKDESSRCYRERTDTQIANLEQQLHESWDGLKSAEQQTVEKEQLVEKQRVEWSTEKAFLDQQLCLVQQQSQAKIKQLEESLIALETDKHAMQDTMADLERQRDQANVALTQQMQELDECKAELDGQQTISTEIAKALEESRRHREELQTQVGELNKCLQSSQRELSMLGETLLVREKDIQTLHDEVQSGKMAHVQLQEEFEQQRVQGGQMELDKDSQLTVLRGELLSQTQQLDHCQARISYLEVEVETLTEQLHSPAVCEEDHNGSMTVDDLDNIHKVNRELEQQLSDKTRTIRQLQQRMAELKRTLQKELKLKPDPEEEAKEKMPESRVEKEERLCSEPPPASRPSPSTSNTTVTNTSDLNDSREINFEYLKHVVLKFMSSRDAEAYQLIRAVSVLLNFTREEEDMLKQTLEYKMSWFGSKPSPKGIIRPSVSGASSPWS
uniref:golgin subfamily A member 1 isoform X2 n=1 Tax=Doryrhamphus excisus TaxID=161450 RepID=UPI0025AE4CC1|nr:golgin subfamily A member 1 isoform X2 [Doryrhamphus excisus]